MTRANRRTQESDMSKINLKPIDDRVVLKILDAEQVTAGGIVLPDSAKEKPQRGTVVAIGAGKLGKEGKRQGMSVKNGDIVLFGKYSGSDVKVSGEDYKIVRESEILAKVEG